MNPDIVVVLIDTLRYDAVAREDLLERVAPRMAALRREGSLGRITANASNTQFVLPALLNGSYPMDYGGYNTGCLERPPGFVERLQAAGYATELVTNCVLYDRDLGFDRGFGGAVSAVNSRRALTQDIEYRLLPVLKRWADGGTSEEAAAAFMRQDTRSVFGHLARIAQTDGRVPEEFPALRRRNRALSEGARAEIALIDRDPLGAARKMLHTPEAFYWATLGRLRGGLPLLTARLRNRVHPFLHRMSASRPYSSALFDAYDVLSEEIEPALHRTLGRAGEHAQARPSFLFWHLMDVHTPRLLANQHRRRPDLIAARERRAAEAAAAEDYPAAAYLGALSSVDCMLGRLVDRLKAEGRWDRTALFITSDHGTTLPDVDGEPVPDLPNRFRPEDTDVPVIAAGGAAPALTGPGALFDSRDFGATVLDAAGLAQAPGASGLSMAGGAGRPAVISENGGRGALDLSRDDLNFAVTGPDSRVLFRLSGDRLSPIRRWPDTAGPAADEALLKHLFAERGALLRVRGVTPLRTGKSSSG